MTNPFDDAAATFAVVTNDEGQHSLWPVGLATPAGWTRKYGPADRDSCLGYVDEHWADLRAGATPPRG